MRVELFHSRISHSRRSVTEICRCRIEQANRISLARVWLCPPPCLFCPLWQICSCLETIDRGLSWFAYKYLWKERGWRQIGGVFELSKQMRLIGCLACILVLSITVFSSCVILLWSYYLQLYICYWYAENYV
jgi:hypothetical protein